MIDDAIDVTSLMDSFSSGLYSIVPFSGKL